MAGKLGGGGQAYNQRRAAAAKQGEALQQQMYAPDAQGNRSFGPGVAYKPPQAELDAMARTQAATGGGGGVAPAGGVPPVQGGSNMPNFQAPAQPTGPRDPSYYGNRQPPRLNTVGTGQNMMKPAVMPSGGGSPQYQALAQQQAAAQQGQPQGKGGQQPEMAANQLQAMQQKRSLDSMNGQSAFASPQAQQQGKGGAQLLG